MSSYVVWVDQDHAKLFKLSAGKVEPQSLKRTEIRHHNHNDPKNHKNTDKFFHDLADHLKDAQELLLVGPGMAKTHFKAHLELHHHEALAKKIVGVETVDHPTDGQILDHARRFFRAHDVFE